MATTNVRGQQIKDGSIQRVDLDVTTSGQAVVRKIIAGTNISLSSSGVDSGTGDVTVNASLQSLDVNFVKNPFLESNSTYWNNGTQISVARTTTSGEVLADTASLKITSTGSVAAGAYIYADLNPFDLAYQNIPMSVEFDFKSLSGYSAGDLQVVLYDGTNEIIPNVTAIPGGKGKFSSVFISSNSSSAYQLRFKSTVSSVAFNMSIDNVYVGPMRVVQGVAIGPTVDYGAVVLGATTTTPTFGTVTNNQTYGRQVGDRFEFWGSYEQTAAGSAGNGTYTIKIPSIVGTIDTTKIDSDSGVPFAKGVCGYFIGKNNGGTVFGGAIQVADNLETYVTFYDPNNTNWGSSSLDFGSNASLRFSFFFSVPIVGWDSTVVLQNSRVSYISNSGSADSSDSTSFEDGPDGSPIPAITSNYYRRVRSPRPITSLTDVVVEIDIGGVGKWRQWRHWYDNILGFFGPDTFFVTGSDTDIDVYMNGNHYAYFDSSNNFVSYSSANSNGDKWRIRITDNPTPVQTPDQYQELIIAHEETSGTDGGTFTSGSWQTLPANTIIHNGIYGSSLSGNEISLPPGDYEIDASHVAYSCDACRMRIYNVTGSSSIKEGESRYAVSTASSSDVEMKIKHRFTITSQFTLRFEGRCSTTHSSAGLGLNSSFTTERYGTYSIRRMNPA